MLTLDNAYPDLRFSPDEIYYTDEEFGVLSKEFFGNSVATLSHRDRAFLQAAVFVAVDKSEKAGLLFSIYKSFMTGGPSQSVTKLLRKLAVTAARQQYSNYIDDDPKYSAAGRAGVQYSSFATEWRVRVGVGDDSFLTDFRRPGR